jgi:tetratricopeptide (TPR) repeat protein
MSKKISQDECLNCHILCDYTSTILCNKCKDATYCSISCLEFDKKHNQHNKFCKKVQKTKVYFTYKPKTLYDCAICMESMVSTENIYYTCMHFYHKKCIDKYLSFVSCVHCPLCRQELTELTIGNLINSIQLNYSPKYINRLINYIELILSLNDDLLFNYNKLQTANTKIISHLINYHIQKGLNENNLDVFFACGSICLHSDNKDGIHFLTVAADQSHIKSQFTLGSYYRNIMTNYSDFKLAIKYYMMAAKQNDIISQLHLGRLYSDNRHEINIDLALKWLKVAASNNNYDAYVYIGDILIDYQLDIEKGIEYYNKALSHGNELAIKRLT